MKWLLPFLFISNIAQADMWQENDKIKHMGFSTVISAATFNVSRHAGLNFFESSCLAMFTAVGLNVAKETVDFYGGGHMDARDIEAGIIGATFGLMIAWTF